MAVGAIFIPVTKTRFRRPSHYIEAKCHDVMPNLHASFSLHSFLNSVERSWYIRSIAFEFMQIIFFCSRQLDEMRVAIYTCPIHHRPFLMLRRSYIAHPIQQPEIWPIKAGAKSGGDIDDNAIVKMHNHP
jgi:hypothetical protein